MKTALKYQDHRTLDSLPSYLASLQVLLPNKQAVFIGYKTYGLDIYFDPDPVLHYDLEGRFIKRSEPNHYLRRSLSHRVLETIKHPSENGGGIRRRILNQEAADTLVNIAARKIRPIVHALTEEAGVIESATPNREEAIKQILPLLEKASRFDARRAHQDFQQYTEIYRNVAILPPDQYNALVLQVTEGCSYNQCTFCGFYRQTHFHMKTPTEFRKHVEQVIAYHGASMVTRRGIFLEQANALTMPQAKLMQIFKIINEFFEFPTGEISLEEEINGNKGKSASWWLGHPRRFDGIYSFIDAVSGLRKTVDDYRDLKALHLRRLYVGMETGDEQLLQFLNKPITPESLLETVRRLKEAGLSVAVIILVGAGGMRYSAKHIERSVAVLNQMPLGKGDFIYLSPLVDMPGSEYANRAKKAGIDFLTPQQLQEQEKAIRALLKCPDPANRPIINRYDIEQFVY